MAKLIFKEDKAKRILSNKFISNKQIKKYLSEGQVARSRINSQDTRQKYILLSSNMRGQMASKMNNLAPKKAQNQRSGRLGMYPVPTGRILERYAYKHNLGRVLPVAKKLLSKPKIIGMDEALDRSKLKKNLMYHEAAKRYPGISPYKDSDGDGVANLNDCRPFDKGKQDEENNIYSDIGLDENEDDSQMVYGENWRAEKLSGVRIANPKGAHGVIVKSKNLETLEPKKPKFK